MGVEYCVETCVGLERAFAAERLLRPMRVERYEAGAELVYDVTGVCPARPARVRLRVDKFIGGGFAGQVYRVVVVGIDAAEGPIDGLTVGGAYAVKIMIPPSGRSELFRDAIYAAGFQGPFSLQSNPSAARAGAIWQKLIRRAAAIRFNDDRAVVDVLATFVDGDLGSCGEISEWVAGRNWRFEVDDDLDARKHPDEGTQASPEYLAKKRFMAEFVRLLHEVGAPELARQYEWWTCKSQPNTLKRLDTEDDPAAGLTAVDFRAGLALLPLLPMSPGDVKLIVKGVARGSLVQFDRGSLVKLQRFMDAHQDRFADLREAMDELKAAEDSYRNSLPDVTHNHVRLLYSGKLWSGIGDAAVTGWRVRNIIDADAAVALRRSRLLRVVFAMLGLIPLLGGAIRKLWGRADCRRHYAKALGDAGYAWRAFRGHVAESLIRWHRAGRLNAREAGEMLDRPARELICRFVVHRALSLLPAGLHRMLSDGQFAREKFRFIFVRPIRLYFDADEREQWLHDMLDEGLGKGMLTGEEAGEIRARVKDPYIQKYLKSLAVHVCTLPITQIVSVAVAIVYVLSHPELPRTESWPIGFAIVGLFQIVPISPGSLTRGLYVLYLVIRERNFKDYNIAVFLGFFKYVGYLAFPIQMAYHYPALARFMAAHWATGAVHIVPVFGESGALMEHGVFDLFYNRPLTIRRRMRARAERRADVAPRVWHAAPIVLAAVGVLGAADLICAQVWGVLPTLGDIWPLACLVPLLVGVAAAVWSGGAALSRRLVLATVCGAAAGALHAVVHAVIGLVAGGESTLAQFGMVRGTLVLGLWRVFIFAIVATIGAFIVETRPLRNRGNQAA